MNGLFSRSAAFDAAADEARATSQLWRILIGLIAITGLYTALIAIFMVAPAMFLNKEQALADMAEGATPRGMVLLLASFAAAWVAVAVVAALLHRRKPLAHAGRIRWRHFPVAAGFVAATGVVSLALASLLTDVEFTRTSLGFGEWAALLALTLPLLAVQTGAEELVFRGYLQQNLAARFRSPIAWAVLPSFLFGAIHWNPEGYGGNALMVIAVIGITSIFLASITARTGDIAAAWGAHFGLNFNALLVIGLEGQLSGLTLWTAPNAADFVKTALMIDLFTLTVAGFIGLRLADRWLSSSPQDD